MKRKKDSAASARGSQRGKLVGKRVDEVKSEELGPSFVDLPSAITSHIMLLLPIKSLLICRCVCSTWKAVISDPHFARLHFQRAPTCVLIRTNDSKRVSRTLHLLEYEPEKFYDKKDQFCSCVYFRKPECKNHLKLELKFKLPLRDAKLVLNKRDDANNPTRQRRYIACKPNNDKFDVVNSCNGILCLCGPRLKDPLVVCNPITGEFIRLPEASEYAKPPRRIFDFDFYVGFGFQPKTNEYKVIRMWQSYQDEQIVQILTLGTSIWRNVGVDPTFLIGRLEFPSYVNGAHHWIKFSASRTSILCFNFESERFLTFPSPSSVFENDEFNVSKLSMGELSGFLCICEPSYLFDSVTIWIMEKYGIGESWTRVFNIPYGYGLYLPVKHFKIRVGILMHRRFRNGFVYYESEKHGFKFYMVRGTTSEIEVIPHIPSLISLKDAVKGDNVEVLNVHSRCANFKLREEKEVLFLAQENV